MVSANENMGMPFAIVVNLEDFSVRFPPLLKHLPGLRCMFKTGKSIKMLWDTQRQSNTKKAT